MNNNSNDIQIGVWALNDKYVPSCPVGTIMYNGDEKYELIHSKPIIFRSIKNSDLWYFVEDSKIYGYWHKLENDIDIIVGEKIKTLDNIEIEIEE